MNDISLCPRCLEESPDKYDTNCIENPEVLTRCNLGMYHCPDCGTMLVAGLKHPKLCRKCAEELKGYR